MHNKMKYNYAESDNKKLSRVTLCYHYDVWLAVTKGVLRWVQGVHPPPRNFQIYFEK